MLDQPVKQTKRLMTRKRKTVTATSTRLVLKPGDTKARFYMMRWSQKEWKEVVKRTVRAGSASCAEYIRMKVLDYDD